MFGLDPCSGVADDVRSLSFSAYYVLVVDFVHRKPLRF